MPRNLLGALVESAIPLSRAVASFLSVCEDVFPSRPDLGSVLSKALADPINFVDRFMPDWRQSEHSVQSVVPRLRFLKWHYPEQRDRYIADLERRLAAVAFQAWSEQVRSVSARRPDVLALTAALLTNPDHPHTLKIARFAIILTLRSLYGVTTDTASIEELREVYLQLATRFGEQERRRVRKEAHGHEPFMMDLLCMGQSVYRAATDDNLRCYYKGFMQHPLGVDKDERLRWFSEASDWPELHGEMPDFPSLLNLALNQPTGVPGLDAVTGGLMSAASGGDTASPGGLINLVAGPPGSGKTTLCMSIASRMAELGAIVAYVTTEEKTTWLEAKRASAVDPTFLANSFWPHASLDSRHPPLAFHEAKSVDTLESIGDRLFGSEGVSVTPQSEPGGIYLPSPYVVIVDSITVILGNDDSAEATSPTVVAKKGSKSVSSARAMSRRRLAGILNRLRGIGVCVFLVGERRHLEDEKLSYLVDNVFILDFEVEESQRHPVRILSVEKTRLQISYRGRHVFHLSRFDGCVISPSLHSVLRRLGSQLDDSTRPERRALLWARPLHQRLLPGVATIEQREQNAELITLRNRSHTLIYGWGSSGKARIALALAFEPRHSVRRREEWADYVALRAASNFERPTEADSDWFDRSRVLVISFLYDRSYYEKIVNDIASARFKRKARPASETVKVMALYPGYLDPETLIARLRRHLQTARLEGRPFTAVVLDGVHNMLMQFPLLTRERLLWPTIFRILRRENVEAISTFTFFQVLAPDRHPGTAQAPDELRMVPDDAQRMFHHLLVSNCDYALLVRSARDGSDRVRIFRTSTIDGFGRERDEFWWDTKTLMIVEGSH